MLKHRLKKHDSPATTIPINILYVEKTIIGKKYQQ